MMSLLSSVLICKQEKYFFFIIKQKIEEKNKLKEAQKMEGNKKK